MLIANYNYFKAQSVFITATNWDKNVLSAPANEVIERDTHGVAFLTQYDGGVNAGVAQLRQYIVGEELVAFLAHIGLDTAYKVRTAGGDFCHQFGQRILLKNTHKGVQSYEDELEYIVTMRPYTTSKQTVRYSRTVHPYACIYVRTVLQIKGQTYLKMVSERGSAAPLSADDGTHLLLALCNETENKNTINFVLSKLGY